ncbi:MAG: hypothetical protein FD138_1989 [Planctomycetota bacterium]|nr:MAG: hypothetical protein FD138_1989 [Planctomycetota bacterium]
MRTTIMYIEGKDDGLTGQGRIGRVRFSKTGKTIYYQDRELQSLKGFGFKANYFDVENRYGYWVSNCRKDGQDTLYPGVIEIDEDVREEYWLNIRELPEKISLTSFRSEGKYSRRKPQPEKPNRPAAGARR